LNLPCVAVLAAAASLLNVSPAAACSGLEGQPCAPKLTRVFHHRFHGFDVYPFGEELQLTIYSAAEQAPASGPEKPDAGQALDTVGDLFAALRSCWVPPAQDEARAGMEMTVRFALKRNGEMIAAPRVTYATRSAPAETRDIYFKAIMAALERCMPLPLTTELASEIVGVPIAARFVDDRKLQ
jgi:hypothetical protein